MGLDPYSNFRWVSYRLFPELSIFYLVVLVTIVVSVSAIVTRAVSAASAVILGLVVLFDMLWDGVAVRTVDFLSGIGLVRSPTSADGLLFLLVRLSPSGAYNVVTNWILGIGNSSEFNSTVAWHVQPGTHSSTPFVVGAAFESGTAPIYLHEAGGLVILLLWMIVPLSIAVAWFSRGDLV